MYPPPPPPPPGIHRPAPEVNTTKSAENYRTQGKTQNSYTPYNMFAPFNVYHGITSPIWDGQHKRSKHTNLHHKRKQAKQRFKRNRR